MTANADDSTPLVSIIIPSYNHAQYIDEAIKSALNQTWNNLELIIIDDGSKDDSHDVIARYSEDPRVRIRLHKKNRGQSHVLNEALDMAKGEFCSILPSDDWYLPRKTELQVKKFLTLDDDYGCIYGMGQRYFEDTGQTVDSYIPRQKGQICEAFAREGNMISPASPMFKMKVFETLRFDEKYTAQGEGLFVMIAINWKYDFVKEAVAVMRDHSYNVGKDADMLHSEVIRFWEEFFALSNLPPNVYRHRAKRLSKIHRIKGLQFIGDKAQPRRGRQALVKACYVDPRNLLRLDVWKGLIASFLPVKTVTWLRAK